MAAHNHTSKLRMAEINLSHGVLKKLLSYDTETGIFTRLTNGRNARAGDLAGNLQQHGYVMVSIGGERYNAHRLAWFYVHGSWPPGFLDHINGNPSDNRISNLRPATPSQNMMNRVPRIATSGGIRGVHWEAQRNKWRAYIYADKKRIHIGRYDTLEEAKMARQKAEMEIHKEFAFARRFG